MSQRLLDHLYRAAAGDESASEVVAEVVIAEGNGQFGPCDRLTPHRSEPVPPHRPPIDVGEEKSIRPGRETAEVFRYALEHPEVEFVPANPSTEQNADEARAICGRCLCRDECLAVRLGRPDPVGHLGRDHHGRAPEAASAARSGLAIQPAPGLRHAAPGRRQCGRRAQWGGRAIWYAGALRCGCSLMTETQRPNFRRPPVAEVALSVQFDPLPGLRVVDFGRIWDEFADEYPLVEEHPAIAPLTVGQAIPPFQIKLADTAEKPRLWFLNENQTRLVQFQQDRLSVNWRRLSDEPYPRYDDTIRPMLVDAWARVERAAETLTGIALTPNMCEALYLNPIESGEVWQRHGELGRVLAPWSGSASDDFLPEPTQARLEIEYPLPQGDGILLVNLTPVRRIDDDRAVLMLQLIGRGQPKGPGFEGALEFLDLAHDWIVRGFKSITTPEMHRAWGIEDA